MYIFTSIGCRAARNPFHIKFIISRLEFVHHSCLIPTTHFAVNCLYYLEFYSFLSWLRFFFCGMAAESDGPRCTTKQKWHTDTARNVQIYD